jgi:hypothetical protein
MDASGGGYTYLLQRNAKSLTQGRGQCNFKVILRFLCEKGCPYFKQTQAACFLKGYSSSSGRVAIPTYYKGRLNFSTRAAAPIVKKFSNFSM